MLASKKVVRSSEAYYFGLDNLDPVNDSRPCCPEEGSGSMLKTKASKWTLSRECYDKQLSQRMNLDV